MKTKLKSKTANRRSVQRMVSLRQIAEYHVSQAEYWSMTKGQSWGRNRSYLHRCEENEKMHKDWALFLRKQANVKLCEEGGK